MVLAQDEARALKHNYIGTEHILLGLLREEEGLAARVLESLDITVERVRPGEVASLIAAGDLRDAKSLAALYLARPWLEKDNTS